MFMETPRTANCPAWQYAVKNIHEKTILEVVLFNIDSSPKYNKQQFLSHVANQRIGRAGLTDWLS